MIVVTVSLAMLAGMGMHGLMYTLISPIGFPLRCLGSGILLCKFVQEYYGDAWVPVS